MTYEPPSRLIEVNIYTPAGWIHGSISVPKVHGFLDHLEHSGPFFKLSSASVPGLDAPVPFLAIRKEAAVIVAPEGPLERLHLPAIGESSSRRVSCLLGRGVVTGDLVVLVHVRLSDYLLHHAGFLVLRHAVVRTRGAEKERGPYDVVMLNGASVVGVAELEDVTERR